MSSDAFKSNSNSSRSLIKGRKIEEQYCKSVSPEPPLLLDIYLSLLLVFRLLLDIKCFALVKFFTIETTHHPIQSTYYPNLVPSKVRTFLSKPSTIQTA